MRLFAALLVIFAASVAHADDCHSQIMIVLDRSCSMNNPPKAGGAQTKWELAGLALQTVTAKYMGKLDFGLIMFPDETGADCMQDGAIYVNVAPDQEANVVAKVMGTTPTGPCVTNIRPAIDQVSVDPAFAMAFAGGARHFVLFISDGEQTCGGNNNMIATSFKTLYDKGYPSYIVGFGDGVDPAALDQFAMNGGVPRVPADMGGHLYYQADDAQSLNDALDQIIGSVANEFVTCPGPPCPDGKCFDAANTCLGGFCQPSPAPTTGTNGSSTGASTGGDGGATGSTTSATTTGRSTGGCGCDLGAAPAGPLSLILLALLAIRRARRP